MDEVPERFTKGAIRKKTFSVPTTLAQTIGRRRDINWSAVVSELLADWVDDHLKEEKDG